MSGSVTVDPPSVPLLVAKYRQLLSVVDEIAAAPSMDVDDVQVSDLARMNEKIVRALTFQGLKRLQDVNDRGLFRKAGHSTLHRFVMSELRVSRGDASSRLKALDAAGELLSMQGEKLPPKCPTAAEALAEGAIGLAHMDVMLKVRDKIPHKSAPEVYDVVDAWLTDNARTLTPTELEVCGREVLARVDPDGSLTDDADRRRNRGLSDGGQGLDMMAKITGNLDPQTLALFRTVMDVWAAPGMNNPDDPNQRQHDAFKAILKTILEYKLLSTSHRGLPVQVIITMTKQQLDEAAGIAHTASGVDLPVKDALELAARSDWSLAVFANHSADVLYFARAKRTAQQGQRMALFAKDRGCTSPGCRNPISWTEIHHTTAWADGGTHRHRRAGPGVHSSSRNDRARRGPVADGDGHRRSRRRPSRVDPTHIHRPRSTATHQQGSPHRPHHRGGMAANHRRTPISSRRTRRTHAAPATQPGRVDGKPRARRR